MHWTPDRDAALARLSDFASAAGRSYAANRNHDEGRSEEGARSNVSQLSPWLHAGLLSEHEVIETVLTQHSMREGDKFVSEVFWRVYFKGYLEQRPTIWRAFLEERDAALASLDTDTHKAEAYSRATEGRTGIAAFDHWARELVETGYLHNHARMWFASIWIFTLRLDWQLGADWFLRHLLDGDAASNTLSWRWVGGLHTKGKTYLARPDNIAEFTARMPGGPLAAEGLAEDAPPLDEAREHERHQLDLPAHLQTDAQSQPFALLLHDEAASHIPLDLGAAPALVIGAARPDARSPAGASNPAGHFAREAVASGTKAAAQAFDCEARVWDDGDDLATILAEAGIEQVVIPYLPQGWTRDALWPAIAPLEEEGRIRWLLSDLERATWPLAKAGFFGVKKRIPAILSDLGMAAITQEQE